MAELERSALSDETVEREAPSLPTKQRLVFIPFCKIRSFNKHPFRLYAGERLDDMVESITKNGILQPLIVRRILDDPTYDYEALSGHNRMNAGKLAGLEGALCLVKEDLSDADAWTYVIETNLLQRSFSELLPSEKAAVLSIRYSEMFSQGKRNDIINELKMLEDPDMANPDATCGTECHKLSREKVGNDYDLKGRMVANYLRIDKLSDALKLRLDNGEFILKVGVEFSYISVEGQAAIDEVLHGYSFRISEQKAALLRKSDKVEPLKGSTCFDLLSGTAVHRSAPSVKVSKTVYAQYFAPDTPPKEIEQIIGKALELYFATQNSRAG